LSTPAFDYRMARGEAIAKVESNVRRIDQNEYRVKSQSGNGEYTVLQTELGWNCSCPDFAFRGVKCKHAFAVELSLQIRRRIENARRLVPLDYQACLDCGSHDLRRDGLRVNKSGSIQIFECKSCGVKFSKNLGFGGMRASPEAITLAMQIYFGGASLRNTQKALRLQGVNVSHVAILKWIRKYVALMGDYLEGLTPQVSDKWRADEVYLKVKGNLRYLFSMMDDETRFWIAQEVADTKERHDVRSLFAKSRNLMGKKPQTIITDGMEAYHVAWRKEYRNIYNPKEPKTVHVRHISLKGDHNNNKMERLNGEFRDREKVMRGVKSEDSATIRGYQIYHNFIRPHEALGGETPAERAGIRIEGRNKWITIIQNACHTGERGGEGAN
jgi:putative transposase